MGTFGILLETGDIRLKMYLKELETLVNRELGNVNEWLKANKLSLNIKKIKLRNLSTRQKNMPLLPTYANLEMKDYVK